MKTQLTQDQIDQYQRDGFLSYPGFLNPAEVEELKAAALNAIATMGKHKVAAGGANLMEEDDYSSKVFTQRLNLWRINDTAKNYMLAPALGKMICQLANVPAFRVWHDQALIKEPYGNPTGWHLDNPYWSFYSPDSISIWIALEEATLMNGCMCFVPGTHRPARYGSVPIDENIGALFNIYPEMTRVDPVAVPMKPGDCSFHNGLCAHGAGANMTRGRRIAMTCAYMPDGSTFNGQQNIMPDDYFHSLSEGDLLNSDELNPIVGRLNGV